MNIFTIGAIYLVFLGLAIISSLMTIQEKLNFERENGVMILTDKNFKYALQENEFIMVEFYAPWCGHCKTLAPLYEKASEELEKSGSKVVLAKLEATTEKITASQFAITGFPTLKFFINGSPIEYNGGRTTNEIIAWIEKKTGPASQEVTSPKELQDMITDNDVVFAYFGESESDKEFEIFKSIALKYDHIKFVHTFNADSRQSVQGALKSVKLFKNFDEKENELPPQSPFTADKLNSFLGEFSYPLVFPWSDTASSKIFTDKKVGVLLIRESYDQASLNIMNEIAKARKMKEGIVFAQIDKQHKDYSKMSEQFGSTGQKLPVIFIVDPANESATYLMEEEELNAKNLDRFINNFKNKRLTKYVKSLPIPAPSTDAVVTLVRKNYDQVVRASDKDFLIMYFATWCGHCTHFKPKYEELAKKLAVNPNLTLAMMDGINNELQDVTVSGYPTIYFFKNGQKTSPVKYEGNRDIDDLIKFMKTHVTYPWIDVSEEPEALEAKESH